MTGYIWCWHHVIKVVGEKGKLIEGDNEKQTRNDRIIDDYYEKICSGKQEKPFHEIILQIGNKDDMGAKTLMAAIDGLTRKKTIFKNGIDSTSYGMIFCI